jgi:hypothetical protein
MVEFQHPVINESDIPTYDPSTQSCTGFVNLKFNHENVYTRKLLSIDLVIDKDQNFKLDIVDENTNRISYDLVGTRTVSTSPERLIFCPVAKPEVLIWTPSNQIMKDWLQTLHVVTSLANLRAKGLNKSKSMEDLTRLSEEYEGKLSFYPLRGVKDKMTDVTSSSVLLQHIDQKCSNGGKWDPICYAVSLQNNFLSPKILVPPQEPPVHDGSLLVDDTDLLLFPTNDVTATVVEGRRTPKRNKSSGDLLLMAY